MTMSRPSNADSYAQISKFTITIGAASSLPTPTIIIDATGITNTNVFAGTEAGGLSATVTYNDETVQGATVTWSGNNNAVATIDENSGAVTLVAAGSVTFTATFAGNESYNSATAQHVMTVTNDDPNAPGTVNNPYTVAQARAAIDAGTGVTGVYVTGIVYEGGSSLSSGSMNYWISDDGTATDKFEIYKGKSFGGNNFTSTDEVQSGDIVVVYGDITKFSSTYEFSQGSTLQSLKLVTPTFSPAAGAVNAGTEVTISDLHTTGTTIYYTTNGVDPTTSSNTYSSAITVDETMTIKAIAVKDNCTNSNVASATYTVSTAPIAVAPTLEPDGGLVVAGSTVSMSTTTTGATIYYTTNGDNPTTSSTQYTAPVAVNEAMTIKAIAVADGYDNSSVTTGTYVVVQHAGTQADPYTVADARIAIDANAGITGVYVTGIVYEGGSSLQTSGDYNGAMNYWISDDGTETNKFEIYKGWSFNNNAFSNVNEVQPGDVVIVSGDIKKYNSTYEFNNGSTLQSLKLVAPTFSPVAGEIEAGSTVAISDLHTVGTTIYYTTDGTDPTTSSTEYTAAITVNEAMTIKAIAVKENCENSNVVSAAYSVTAPAPVINASDVNIAYDATNGSIEYTIDNGTGSVGASITTGDWLDLGEITTSAVSFTCSANEGNTDRTATVTLSFSGAADKVITVTQGHFEVDYATLPFNYEGGVLDDFLGMDGTSHSLKDQGSYAAGNVPYRIKFTATGDYIQVKTDSRPEKVTIGVKMIGGSNTSTITVKASVDGETFDDGEALTISGSQNDIVNLETTRSFGADVRYIKMVFTKGSNIGVGPISIAKYVTKYAVNLNQPQNNEGTIAADKETAAEGETVTLTATPNTGYAFDSWTVLDGSANEVTVTNNTFIMPASNVEVEATFTTLPKHNIVIPAAIENNVIVDATNNQAYANETVTITVDAPDNKVLATLTVTGNTSTNNITIAPEVSPYVNEYTFTMPDEDVTINATFDNAPSFTVSFSVNGTVDNNLEVSVTQGQSTTLPTSSTRTPEGFAITGWAATNGSAEAVADPYTPTANITLFAILGQTIPHSLVINSSTPNFPTSYGTANTFTEYNLAGKNFMIQQGYKNGSILQWRASGNNNGTGTMYNSEDLGKINTIILVYDSSDANKNFTIKAGTTENPSGGDNITPTFEENGLVYTFDLSQDDYNYFVMTNGTNAGYLQSISIDYVADLNVNTITHITTSTTYTTNIPATTCVVVESSAVLTLNGTNNGTVDNLIIEDGGQLVTSNPVAATIQKNITSSAKTDWSDWYFISSPLDGATTDLADIENLMPSGDGYDLYAFDQEQQSEEWRNFKNDDNNLTVFNAGQGYLYANTNSGTPIAFSGTVRATKDGDDWATFNQSLAYTEGKRFAGWNLVGNPFPTNATVNRSYYKLNNTSEGLNTTPYAANGVIASMEGVFVRASGTKESVTFTATTNKVTSASGSKGAITLNVESGNEFLDRAIVSINEGGMLNKLSLTKNATKLYFQQGEQEFAIVVANGQGEMPVNFKAGKNGTYTISVEPENVEVSYLHLIDNLTGANVDLLANPSYSFEANTNDYASRFRLVFKTNADVEDNTATETFAYYNGSEWVISNPSTGSGSATLQVIDVMGRVLRSEQINGNTAINLNQAAGIYMLRLINGENVMVQKVVVR